MFQKISPPILSSPRFIFSEMPLSHLRMYVPSLPVNPLSNTHLSPQSSCRASLVKNKSPQICFLCSFTAIHTSRALSVVDTEEISDFGDSLKQKLSSNSSEENILIDEIQLYSSSISAESLIDNDQKERERRKKIGLANKGNVPWNKGRKHTPETREWISQRTKEALMDPKIRKKMSESPHVISDQTKAKISTSLKRVWGKRLEWKRSRAKFLSSWTESIAEAAKKGGGGQRELYWDSYDKIKEEIAIEQRQAADRAKAKKTAKEEKMARLAQKKKEQEQKAKARGELGSKCNRKSKEEREELAIAQGIKLKERLTKLHKIKTSMNGQISGEERAWEKLDLERIKKEQKRREVPLADQIRVAKTKKSRMSC